MKKCIHCGKEIPEQASWCPYCEKSQKEQHTVKAPARHRKALYFLAAAVLCIAVCVSALARRHIPKTYEGGAEVAYTVDGKESRVFLGFSSSPAAGEKCQEEITDTLPAGETAAIPSRLCVSSPENPEAVVSFMNEVDTVSISATQAENSKAVEIRGPDPGSERGLDAAYVADIVYSPATGTNTVCWELRMKNGDILRLYQRVTCKLMPTLEYHWEDTPMETTEQISSLLQDTAQEAPDSVLKLFLPPVTYTGELVIDSHTAVFYGTEEEGKKTTFSDTVTVLTREPQYTQFLNIDFVGAGGTGIVCREALYMQGCLISGWDTGLDVQSGGWASVSNAAFVGNKTGFRFNSDTSSYSNPSYENLVFAENELGLQIVQIPGSATLYLKGTVFDANGKDMDDPDGYVRLE